MLQKENTFPADTFTTKPDNFKKISYRGHQWFEFDRKPIKLGNFMTGLIFYPMLIVASMTSRTNGSEVVMMKSGSENM